MSDSAARREYIFEVLNGTSPDLVPLDQGSALVLLATEDPKEFRAPSLLISIIAPAALIFGMLALAVSFYEELYSPLLQLGEAALLILLLLWLWRQSTNRQVRFKRFKDRVRAAQEELEQIQSGLENYLANLDERTSKYFHAVTNTKVATYFVLMQIRDALFDRVEAGRSFVHRGKSGLVKTCEALSQPLTFRDGALATAGNIHNVPLSRIGRTIELLIQHLDQGINEMEAEIEAWNGVTEENETEE